MNNENNEVIIEYAIIKDDKLWLKNCKMIGRDCDGLLRIVPKYGSGTNDIYIAKDFERIIDIFNSLSLHDKDAKFHIVTLITYEYIHCSIYCPTAEDRERDESCPLVEIKD